jgi:hypothetical protein
VICCAKVEITTDHRSLALFAKGLICTDQSRDTSSFGISPAVLYITVNILVAASKLSFRDVLS